MGLQSMGGKESQMKLFSELIDRKQNKADNMSADEIIANVRNKLRNKPQ